MKRQLPARPDLEQLKHQAKDLLNAWKADEPDALERFQKSHPRPSGATAPIHAGAAQLSDAQLVIAREYGFDSWPKLKAAVEDIQLDQGDPAMLLHEAFRTDNA